MSYFLLIYMLCNQKCTASWSLLQNKTWRVIKLHYPLSNSYLLKSIISLFTISNPQSDFNALIASTKKQSVRFYSCNCVHNSLYSSLFKISLLGVKLNISIDGEIRQGEGDFFGNIDIDVSFLQWICKLIWSRSFRVFDQNCDHSNGLMYSSEKIT